MDNEIYDRHAWRTIFITSIGGGLAPATMLSCPSWEQKVVKNILKEHSDESKQLKEILKKQSRKLFVDFLILIALVTAVISYRLIYAIQLIFVQITPRIDLTMLPVTAYGFNRSVGTVDGLSLC